MEVRHDERLDTSLNQSANNQDQSTPIVPYKPNLPRLIFTDTHYDPIIGSVLTILLPKLADLGYACFLAEIPEDKSLSDQIGRIKHDSIFIHMVNDEQKDKLVDRVNTGLALLPFYENLNELNVGFKGIDILGLDDESICSFAVSEQGIIKRDKQFSQYYLNEDQEIFAMVGFKHAIGVQNNIIKVLPPEVAANMFYFVHIYQKDMEDYEKYVRDNKIIYPLGLQCIDANKMNIDEIENEIIKNIELKKGSLNRPSDREQFERKLKEKHENKLKTNSHCLFNSELMQPIPVEPCYRYNVDQVVKLLKKHKLYSIDTKKVLTDNIEYIQPLSFLLSDIDKFTPLTKELFEKVIFSAKSTGKILEICDLINDERISLNFSMYEFLLTNSKSLDDIYGDLRAMNRNLSTESLNDYFSNFLSKYEFK